MIIRVCFIQFHYSKNVYAKGKHSLPEKIVGGLSIDIKFSDGTLFDCSKNVYAKEKNLFLKTFWMASVLISSLVM